MPASRSNDILPISSHALMHHPSRFSKGSVFVSLYSRSYTTALLSISLKQSGLLLRSSTSYVSSSKICQCCTCHLVQAPCHTTSNNIFGYLQEGIEVPFVSIVFLFTCSEHYFCATLVGFSFVCALIGFRRCALL